MDMTAHILKHGGWHNGYRIVGEDTPKSGPNNPYEVWSNFPGIVLTTEEYIERLIEGE